MKEIDDVIIELERMKNQIENAKKEITTWLLVGDLIDIAGTIMLLIAICGLLWLF